MVSSCDIAYGSGDLRAPVYCQARCRRKRTLVLEARNLRDDDLQAQ